MKAMCPPSYYRNGFMAIIYIILTLFTSCAQSTINWKNDNDVIFCWHDAIIECFWRWRVSLVKLSYWLNFNVSIIAGSWIMKLVYKRLTRNPKIGNTPVWVSPNIWWPRQVRCTKFGRNVSNEKLLNAAKCQVCSFYLYRFWVSKGKPIGGGKNTPNQIRVKKKDSRNLKI